MKVSDPDKWFSSIFSRSSPMFQAGVSDQIKAAAEKDAGKPLSEEDVQHLYLREQFKRLYTKPKDQSRVGQ